MDKEEKEPSDKELDRLEALGDILEKLAPIYEAKGDEGIDLERLEAIKDILPVLQKMMAPREHFNHVSYSAKLAISRYQNHQISFGKRVPMNGDFYKAFTEVMTKTFNFHEAILSFRHLQQHIIGLKSERHGLLRDITNRSDQYERHKADLIALVDQTPAKDADILQQAEHQRDVLCRRESIQEEEKHIEELKEKTQKLWEKIVKYTNSANDLGYAIKKGEPEKWNHLPPQFEIPLDEGHQTPDYHTPKRLRESYSDYEDRY